MSPYNYVLNNPISNIDPDGRWVIRVNNGNIFLTAEEGDNVETLKAFFGGGDNAIKYIPERALNKYISYSKGDEVQFNDDNVFSRTMLYYHENSEDIIENNTYDCKELCRQLILNEAAIEYSFQGGYDARGLARFGKDWNKKVEVDKSEHKFGESFSYWSWTTFPVGDHAAIYFGKDRQGNEYWFSKNGSGGPLKILTTEELEESYYLLDFFRGDYKKQ